MAKNEMVKVGANRRLDFVAKAGTLQVQIADNTVVGTPKEFSSGSVGWNVNGKVMVTVNGELLKAQFSGNIVVIGSKEW